MSTDNNQLKSSLISNTANFLEGSPGRNPTTYPEPRILPAATLSLLLLHITKNDKKLLCYRQL
jgi:hypothetical protein